MIYGGYFYFLDENLLYYFAFGPSCANFATSQNYICGQCYTPVVNISLSFLQEEYCGPNKPNQNGTTGPSAPPTGTGSVQGGPSPPPTEENSTSTNHFISTPLPLAVGFIVLIIALCAAVVIAIVIVILVFVFKKKKKKIKVRKIKRNWIILLKKLLKKSLKRNLLKKSLKRNLLKKQ